MRFRSPSANMSQGVTECPTRPDTEEDPSYTEWGGESTREGEKKEGSKEDRFVL